MKKIFCTGVLLLMACTMLMAQGKARKKSQAKSLVDSIMMLSEITVTGQKSSVKLEVDRKTYDVSNDLSNIGGTASDALENIPSVEVDNDGNISLRGSSSVEVWCHDCRSSVRWSDR